MNGNRVKGRVWSDETLVYFCACPVEWPVPLRGSGGRDLVAAFCWKQEGRRRRRAVLVANETAHTLSRQRLLTAALASFASSPSLPAFALPNLPASIKERLDSQNSQLLLKPLNQGLATPSEAAYPDWLEGEWNAAQSFAGYELPAKDLIPREALFAEAVGMTYR